MARRVPAPAGSLTAEETKARRERAGTEIMRYRGRWACNVNPEEEAIPAVAEVMAAHRAASRDAFTNRTDTTLQVAAMEQAEATLAVLQEVLGPLSPQRPGGDQTRSPSPAK